MKLLIPLSGKNGWNDDLTIKGCGGRRERKEELSPLSHSNMGTGYHGERNLCDTSEKPSNPAYVPPRSLTLHHLPPHFPAIILPCLCHQCSCHELSASGTGSCSRYFNFLSPFSKLKGLYFYFRPSFFPLSPDFLKYNLSRRNKTCFLHPQYC